jgi:hypothetical protein
MIRNRFKPLRFASVLFFLLVFASFLRAQDATDPSTPGKKTLPSGVAAAQSNDGFPLNDRQPTEPPATQVRDSSEVDSGYAEDSRDPDEFLSTSRDDSSQNKQTASSAASDISRFWAFHEKMLASVAATGVVSDELSSGLKNSTLSSESKELLLRRHGLRVESVAAEFTSESRDWDPRKTYEKLRDGNIPGAITGVDFRIPENSTQFSDGRDYSYWITVRIRNQSGWNVSMRFSGGASARKLPTGNHYPSLKVKSPGTTARSPWIELQQPDGNWGTRWRLTDGKTYKIVDVGGNEPLVIKVD